MKEKIGIIIDSSSTFTEEFITKNNIRVAPLSLVDSQSKVYTDNGRDISQKEFVSRLRNGENFKTSMTSIGQLMDICDEMFKIYQNIIFLPVSKGLSGQ
jgi:fatty acid-binding protein DegV